MSVRRTSSQSTVTASRPAVLPDDDGGIVPLYRHPVFWAAGLFTTGLLAAFAGVMSAVAFLGSTADLPEYKGGGALPAPRGVSLTAGSDEDATDMLRGALLAQGERRRELMSQLLDKFPAAPESMLISAEYARLTAAWEQAQEQKRLKLEADAAAAWEVALKQEKDAAKFPALLKEITARFPGTKAAQDADERLQKIPAPATPPKPAPVAEKTPPAKPVAASGQPAAVAGKPAAVAGKPAAQPVAPKPVKPAAPARKWEFPFTNDVITRGPLTKFSTQFHEALQDWDLTSAKALADSFASSKKYPQLSGFGKACAQDVEVLLTFERRLTAYYSESKNKSITLTLVKGTKLTGTFSKVENRELTVLLDNRFPQKVQFPLGLNAESVLAIYEQNRKPEEPDPALVRALFFFAVNNDELATQMFFQKIAGSDNRANVHDVLMKTVYGGDK